MRYPIQIFFIIANEFCERYSYYGMRTILTYYLSDFLNFSETNATAFYHAFVSLCYYTPVIGAILVSQLYICFFTFLLSIEIYFKADSFLGKFRTIFYISIIYAIGQLVLTVGAFDFGGSAVWVSFIGLGLIAFGTGKSSMLPLGIFLSGQLISRWNQTLCSVLWS